MDIVIKPAEGDWSTFADPAPKIAEWEKSTGRKLPEDYKKFMSKYDGGRIYPLIFDRKIPLEVYSMGTSETFLNMFYPWQTVAGIWNGEMFADRTPPDFVVVGSSPGGVEVLLSLADETHGQIFLWLHSPSDWGTGDNKHVWRQEDSFRAFVESLYENEEEEGHEYWYLPSEKGMEKKVEF
jgi:hypothetical protein